MHRAAFHVKHSPPQQREGPCFMLRFAAPASPAMGKTQGVLTVNGVMTICSSERESQNSRTAKTPD